MELKTRVGWAVGLGLLTAGVGVVRWRGGRGMEAGEAGEAGAVGPRLVAVGPKLTSNQTTQPLAVYGEGLVPGLRLALGPPLSREVPLEVVDGRHGYARLPAGLELPAERVQARVEVTLVGVEGVSGAARLTVVNDAAFVDLTAMALSPDGKRVLVASPPTDTVYAVEVETGRVEAWAAGDGPSALAPYVDGGGRAWLAVAHRYEGALYVYALDAPEGAPESAPRVVRAPAGALGLVVDGARGMAYVAEHVRDAVHAVSLEDGKEAWVTRVDPNPRALARWRGRLVVGSLQTGQVEVLREEDGVLEAAAVPGPGVAIVGGGTERFREQVMGGKAVRALAGSERLGRVFMASTGPNVGPNAERMEVSANGGVAVVEPEKGVVERHRGFGAGVTEGLALDEARGLLYAADVGLGQVRVLDARKLVEGDDAARGAVLQELVVTPVEGTPWVRPAEDFGTKGRAGLELHSGPRALALSGDGRALYVLNRFTGTVAVVDVAEAREGRARLVKQWPVAEMRAQAKRRLGQVLYYADLGRTAMSCDACHLEGHTEGVFFEKTRPMRVYRSSTALGSRDTPPYFTPASTRSLAETMQTVGSRNRFHNPDMTPPETEALTLFVSLLPTPPNPFRGEGGAPLEGVELPDGRRGHPGRGRALFEERGCQECHPAPLYTTDQEPATRGRYLDVGTPRVLPLRAEQQDGLPGGGFAPPSLVGAWDIWPMLGTGSAGYEVREGNRLAVGTRFALRAVAELSGPAHGDMRALSAQEQDDLLAFLMTL